MGEVLAASARAVASDAASGLLPAQMLNEFAYCPRLCYLERVHGEFADRAETFRSWAVLSGVGNRVTGDE